MRRLLDGISGRGMDFRNTLSRTRTPESDKLRVGVFR
jgi:hypothetical protein